MFTPRNYLVYLNYTFSAFNPLMPGGDKKSQILKQTCSWKRQVFSALITFCYYQAMKVNGY